MQVAATNLPETECPIYTTIVFYPPQDDGMSVDQFFDLLKRIVERAAREQEASGVIHEGIVRRSG